MYLTKQRIGAYGGTFDPIHMGHMEIARSVVSNFQLDQLLVIPAYKPPHKSLKAISDSRHRYEMCLLAFAEDARIVVSKMEIDLPERPYTINTIERLQVEYGKQTQLFFVMGADSFEEITGWRQYQRLLSSTSIIVAARAGQDISINHLPEMFREKVIDARSLSGGANLINDQGCLIYLTDFVNCEVSSTQIRQRVQAGLSIADMTAPVVAEYIAEHGLYRQA